MELQPHPTSSSRILYDVPCVVCLDNSSGKHYGVYACDGCAGFFKRSIRRDRKYACKARQPGTCIMDKAHRNQCRACRLAKCLHAGMNKDAVQHERGPRNSTIRRQMALYLNDPIPTPTSTINQTLHGPHDLDLSKHVSIPSSNILDTYPNPYSLNLFRPPLNICIPKLPLSQVLFSNLMSFQSGYPSPMLSSPPICKPVVRKRSAEDLCEAAAQILFMNMTWAKSVPSFKCLSLSDRLLLLQESWRDLFVIAAAQYMYPIEMSVLFNGDSNINRNDVDVFENALKEVSRLMPDENEFECLRTIVLFKTRFLNTDCNKGTGRDAGDNSYLKKLQDVPTVAALQDHSHKLLYEHSVRTHHRDPSRATKILQLLPIIRNVSALTIEDLFFRSTIGDAGIDGIISDMYRRDNAIL